MPALGAGCIAQVQGLPGAQVELLDPAGQRVDRASPDAHGQVQLRGLARAPGEARSTR